MREVSVAPEAGGSTNRAAAGYRSRPGASLAVALVDRPRPQEGHGDRHRKHENRRHHHADSVPLPAQTGNKATAKIW